VQKTSVKNIKAVIACFDTALRQSEKNEQATA
jgi:hypothetical protein